MSHTYAVLPVEPGVYDYLKDKLEGNGYDHDIVDANVHGKVLWMRDLALMRTEVGKNPVEALRDYLEQSGRKLTPEEDYHLSTLQGYCDELVSQPITRSDQNEG